MEKNYVLGEDAQQKIEMNLALGKNWITYNSDAYFLEAKHIGLFANKIDAIIHASLENLAEQEYKIFYASSLAEVYKRLPYELQLKQISSLQKHNIMNEQNFEYLKENLKNMGFGDKLNKDLEINIRAGVKDFQLPTEANFNGQKMEALLSFRQGDQNEMYFFNKYTAALIKDGETDLAKSQIFYLTKGYGATFKEAFNLLEGRAVNKDLTDSKNNKYNAWLQIDFSNKDKNGNNEVRQYHQNYGFDIEKALNKQPIKELENADDRKLLVSSLKKGNLQQVNFEVDNIRSKMFIEANPKLRTLNVYDSEKKLVVQQTSKKELSNTKENSKEEIKDIKKDNKQERNNKRIKNELEQEGKTLGKKL
jgi:hypothetical protein